MEKFKNVPYIFNLGHGILPSTDPETVKNVVNIIKNKMNKDHPKINFGKTGVLLINLGTPNSTSWLDIRKYLKEFLSDRRVIELNPIFVANYSEFIYFKFKTIKDCRSIQKNLDDKRKICLH